MVESSVLAKIRKLLKLAADPANAYEAALAAERAQELLFRHKLEMADVSDDPLSDVVEVDRPYIFVPWRKMLAAVLAKYNFCRLLEWPGGMKFIGTKPDVETVLYLYAYLSRTIFRLSREGWAARVADLTDPLLGRHPALLEDRAEQEWLESFRIGAVEVIGLRLQKQRDTQDALARYDARKSNEPGLVKATSALQAWDGMLSRYIHDKYGPVHQVEDTETSINMDGFTQGVKTAKNLPLSRGVGSGVDRRRIDG